MSRKRPFTLTCLASALPVRSALPAWSALPLFSALTFCAVVAHAEPTAEQKAGARAAANAGADAFEGGRFAEALDLFQRAESVVHSPMHELFAARSLSKLGRLVEARELYLKIQRENSGPNGNTRALEGANNELPVIEPRIGRLTIQVEGSLGLSPEVSLDGKPVPAALLGLPQPADPGAHHLVARAGGAQTEQDVTLKDGEKSEVKLTLVGVVLPSPEEQQLVKVDDGSSKQAVPPQAPEPDLGLRIASYASFGVGAAGLALGGIFLANASNKATEADKVCKDETGSVGCQGASNSVQSQVEQLDKEYRDARTIATIGLIAGGVGVAAGVTLFVLSTPGSRSSEVAERGVSLRPIVAGNYLGVDGLF